MEKFSPHNTKDSSYRRCKRTKKEKKERRRYGEKAHRRAEEENIVGI